jgi:nitrogen fixation NifU-like protein
VTQRSLYDDVVMDHIKNARNYRPLTGASHLARGVNPLCGDTFSVYVRVENAVVREAAFQCECCGISMASASIMTELVTGRPVVEVRRLVHEFTAALKAAGTAVGTASLGGDAAAMLNLIRQSPSRINCARLGWLTLESALDGRVEAVLET